MRIKIELSKAAEISAALLAVNGKAESFCVTSFEELESAAKRAEAQLEKSGLTKKSRKGVQVVFVPAGPTANAYKHAAISTLCRIERGADAWFLVSSERRHVYPRQKEAWDVAISASQRDETTRAALAGYVLPKDPPAIAQAA